MASNNAVEKRTRGERRSTFSWALWDWAEQPYPTIMQTFIFPVYLTGAVGASVANADVQLGWATGLSGLALALIAPVLGRRSDANGRRKFWLMVNTYALVLITALSFLVAPSAEYFLFGLVLYGVGSVVQESSFINYYAMLKQVTNERTIGRISGYAWGLGYAGGIILLLMTLVGFVLPDVPWFGIPTDSSLNVRAIFLFSAVWILIFSVPLLLWVPEIQSRQGAKRESIAKSYAKTWSELMSLKQQAPETFKFLVSSAIYRDGLAGVFTFGAVLGTLAFGFDQTSIIFFGIAANLVSGLGAVFGGRLDDRFGSRAVIIGSLVGLLASGIAVFALAGLGQITYWIFGLALCLFVGPAQASSRAFVSRFTPHGREGEVFGLYQFTGRAVSFLSGSMWALSISTAAAFGISKDATIYGIWGLMAILAVGLWLLTRVSPNPKVIN